MNIRKKLYINFGAMLALVLVLFAANLIAVQREHAGRAATARALANTQGSEAIRFQLMNNRLSLRNYLLSGDTREVDKLNDGIAKLNEMIKAAQNDQLSDKERGDFARLLESERSWQDNFARPLVEKRKAVDSGNATVAELQIFYLQLNPGSWMKASAAALDDAEGLNAKLLEEQRK